MQNVIKILLLCAMCAFVACNKVDEVAGDSQGGSFDFGALKSEAEAQEIDLSKIILADSTKGVDSAKGADSAKGVDSAFDSAIDSANVDSTKGVDSAIDSAVANPNNALISAPKIIKSMAKFYLLEGEIDGQNAMLYLKISSLRDDAGENSALAYITGKIVRGAETFALKGEVESEAQTLALEISIDDRRQIFEAQIAQNGEVSGKFIGDEFFQNEASFKRAQGKINEVAFFGVSVAQKHKGKDFDGQNRDFEYNVSMQIPRISSDGKMNLALDAINGALREMAMPDLSEYGEDSINFSNVLNFDVEYIDERVIVFGNYNYIYSGGAHGNYSNDAVAFDLKSGARISNEAKTLLKDENDPALMAMIKKKLKAEYGDSVDSDGAPTNFRINHNGVEFYWGIYEIAPYALGIVRINFTFDELAKFIKDDSIYAYLFNSKI